MPILARPIFIHIVIIGKPSCEIYNADELFDHIIITGNDSNYIIFINELRKENLFKALYRPILIVDTIKPTKWDLICSLYNDVYFIKCDIARLSTFHLINPDFGIHNASSHYLYF